MTRTKSDMVPTWPGRNVDYRTGWEQLSPSTRRQYRAWGVTRRYYRYGMPLVHARERKPWERLDAYTVASYGRRGITREHYDYGMSLVDRTPAKQRRVKWDQTKNGGREYRKGWDDLTENTRQRYERSGITRDNYRDGTSVRNRLGWK